MHVKILSQLGVRVSPALRLSLPGGAVELSPESAFKLAEQLLRRGARRVIEEEITRPAPKKRAAR